MSNSGRFIGACLHRCCPDWCVECLRAALARADRRLQRAVARIPWHRDGKGPDVPVLQERYNTLLKRAREAELIVKALQAENFRLQAEAAWLRAIVDGAKE